MLRSLVLILLIVNVTFFAWSQGWLNTLVGVRPDQQHEPQRLQQQVHAEKLDVVTEASRTTPPPSPLATPTETASASSAPQVAASAPPVPPPAASVAAASAPEPTVCLEAGPFDNADMTVVNVVLNPILARYQWRINSVEVSGQWLVYMGPYTDKDLYERKRGELRQFKGLAFEEVHSPASLNPGFALGRYTRQQDAEATLSGLKDRGVRSARIVTLRQPGELDYVRVPAATAAQQASLAKVRLPQRKTFGDCRQR